MTTWQALREVVVKTLRLFLFDPLGMTDLVVTRWVVGQDAAGEKLSEIERRMEGPA